MRAWRPSYRVVPREGRVSGLALAPSSGLLATGLSLRRGTPKPSSSVRNAPTLEAHHPALLEQAYDTREFATSPFCKCRHVRGRDVRSSTLRAKKTNRGHASLHHFRRANSQPRSVHLGTRRDLIHQRGENCSSTARRAHRTPHSAAARRKKGGAHADSKFGRQVDVDAPARTVPRPRRVGQGGEPRCRRAQRGSQF